MEVPLLFKKRYFHDKAYDNLIILLKLWAKYILREGARTIQKYTESSLIYRKENSYDNKKN